MISFIMPAYKAQFIDKAIESIVAQTYSDWELVVVDDKSPEDLCAIVEKYKSDERIRYYRNVENIGGKDLCAQWNHCVKYAKGDWIVLAADDDVYSPQFCESCVDLMIKHPNIDLIRSRVMQINEDGEICGVDVLLPEYIDMTSYVYYWLIGGMVTCMGNFMFRSDVLSRYGFVDFPCAFGTDIVTPIMLAKNGVANTSEMLYHFRISDIHLSSNLSRLHDKAEGIMQLYDWLGRLKLEESDDKLIKYYGSFLNSEYLHKKFLFDYFNLIVKHTRPSKLYRVLSECRLASRKDKMMMTIRYIAFKLMQKS